MEREERVKAGSSLGHDDTKQPGPRLCDTYDPGLTTGHNQRTMLFCET